MEALKKPNPDEVLRLLASHSPPLAAGLARRPGLAEFLFDGTGLTEPVGSGWLAEIVRAESHPEETEEALQGRLRLAKETVFIRLALRDLAGLAPLEEVVQGTTRLAELAIQEALAVGLRLTLAKKGLGPWPAKAENFFCVLGFGKLGGRELNYSSDVDLVYLFEPALWPFEQPFPAAEVAAQVGSFIGRALGTPTGQGLVFRVDMDLRPAGKDGALVPSLEAAKRHYLDSAAEWERLALLKARPVAGNPDLGRELIEETRPFVYRRHLDYTALEELRRMKARFAGRTRSRTARGIDLKLGRGGIRQIEFFAQTLQLIYGGRSPNLRNRSTLEALTLLAEQGLIDPVDRDELSEAYIFLRRAEHRLQLKNLAQTQTLPPGPGPLEELGRAMGNRSEAVGDWFKVELEHHRAAVSLRFDSLLGGEDEAEGPDLAGLFGALETGSEEEVWDILATAGFEDPVKAAKSIEGLTADNFLGGRLPKQNQLLAQVLPAILEKVLLSAEPDAALIRLESFLAKIGPKTGLFLLLQENPSTLDLLVNLMSTSAYLARTLTTHPGLLDSLIDVRNEPVKDLAQLETELDLLLEGQDDEEELAGLVRRFKAEETVRIAVQDLTEGLGLERIADQLTDLSEVVLSRTIRLAEENLRGRYGPEEMTAGPDFAVLGMGKMGGAELSYNSDLDVVFLYRLRPGAPSGRKFSPPELAIKLAQRAISLLSVPMSEGPGYELDARLRPSGTKGPLVVSLDSFIDYHRTSELWERLALIKFRAVAGDPDLGRDALAAAHRAAFDRPLEPGWVAEIERLRGRMLKERAATKGLDLKMGPGGLVDVEFAAQAMILRHGQERPEVRSPHTLKGLTLLFEAGLLDEPTYQTLFEGYRFLRTLDKRLRLIHDKTGSKVGYSAADLNRAGADLGRAQETCGRIARAARRVMDCLREGD